MSEFKSKMPDKDATLRALHCRAQDLMIDLPPCDQCEYRFEMPNGSGCDFRRLCRDAAELMTEPGLEWCERCGRVRLKSKWEGQ